MKRILYILALIAASVSYPAVAAPAALGAHLHEDADYLACVLPKIPVAARQKTALLLWPTPLPAGPGKTCSPAIARLNPQEIKDLQQTLQVATVSCQGALPADPDSRADATYGLLGVFLINPQTPTDTAAWDELMAGSRACATASPAVSR